MALPESALDFVSNQAGRIRTLGRIQRIVFPEGGDPRIIAAAQRLSSEGLAEPILVTAEGEPEG